MAIQTNEQIGQKPLSDDELNDVAGGMDVKKPTGKRVLKVELDDDVKKVSITGLGDDDKVVMMQELSEEDLDEATGGGHKPLYSYFDGDCLQYAQQVGCPQDENEEL